MLLLSSTDFKLFQKILSGTLSVTSSLDPDLARHSVRPDLGPNCFQRLSKDDKLPLARTELRGI